MNNYLSILLYLGLAELLRRFISALILAFTGPLSKIPGPLLWKLTPLPWLYECLTGNMMNVAPGLFEKYGDVVRVGKSINLILNILQNLTNGYTCKAPKDVLFANKAGVQQILIDDDLVKAPVYRPLQTDAKVTSLISERDKVAYKAKVNLPSPFPVLIKRRLTKCNAIEKTPLTRFLHQLFEWLRTLDARMHPRIRRISRR
jgi:hypothetical protein